MKILFLTLNLILLVSCSSTQYSENRLPDLSKLKSVFTPPLTIVNPKYPRKAAENGIVGWVLFEFYLDSQGRPIDLVVVDSYPENTFVKQASKAIKQWTFEASDIKNNKLRNNYVMEFKLKGI